MRETRPSGSMRGSRAANSVGLLSTLLSFVVSPPASHARGANTVFAALLKAEAVDRAFEGKARIHAGTVDTEGDPPQAGRTPSCPARATAQGIHRSFDHEGHEEHEGVRA